jgi:hypothetical protein
VDTPGKPFLSQRWLEQQRGQQPAQQQPGTPNPISPGFPAQPPQQPRSGQPPAPQQPGGGLGYEDWVRAGAPRRPESGGVAYQAVVTHGRDIYGNPVQFGSRNSAEDYRYWVEQQRGQQPAPPQRPRDNSITDMEITPGQLLWNWPQQPRNGQPPAQPQPGTFSLPFGHHHRPPGFPAQPPPGTPNPGFGPGFPSQPPPSYGPGVTREQVDADRRRQQNRRDILRVKIDQRGVRGLTQAEQAEARALGMPGIPPQQEKQRPTRSPEEGLRDSRRATQEAERARLAPLARQLTDGEIYSILGRSGGGITQADRARAQEIWAKNPMAAGQYAHDRLTRQLKGR